MKKKLIAILAILFLSLSATGLYAEDGEEVHQNEHADHANHLGIFLGATSHLGAHGTTVFTAGLDYERKFVPLFGAGILFDFPFESENYEFAMIVAVPLSLHPFAGLKVTVAPGIEYAHSATEFLLRAGLGYDIAIGKYTLTPTLSYDYVFSAHPTSALVYGLTIGRGF
ncbi:MAG: hypothetical protein ABUK01_11620 [Leptospirales bacterium]